MTKNTVTAAELTGKTETKAQERHPAVIMLDALLLGREVTIKGITYKYLTPDCEPFDAPVAGGKAVPVEHNLFFKTKMINRGVETETWIAHPLGLAGFIDLAKDLSEDERSVICLGMALMSDRIRTNYII